FIRGAKDDVIHIYLNKNYVLGILLKKQCFVNVKKIFKYLKGQPNLGLWYTRDSPFQLEDYSDSDYAGSHGDKKYTTGGCQFLDSRLISWQCKKQIVVATSSTEVEYVAAASCYGQVLKIHTDENVADLLTKAFDETRFHYLCLVGFCFMLITLLAGLQYCWWYWFMLMVSTGGCTLPAVHTVGLVPTGSGTNSAVKQFWATSTVHNHEAGSSQIIANIDGNEVVVIESLIRTQLQLNDVDRLYEFTLTNVLDRMRVIGQLIFQYEVKLGWTPYASFGIHVGGSYCGDGADAVAASAAAKHDPIPVREPTPVREPSPVRKPTPLREPTPIREPTPRLVRDPTPDSPRHPSPPLYPRSEESNEAPPTLAATAAGGAEDSAALTALSLKLDKCLNRVTSLENELGITKKVLGGAILKLVTRVKRLEGLLQQRNRRLVLSDSEGEDATPTEQDIDLEALHMLASTSLGGDSSYKVAGHDAAEVPADTTMPFRSTSNTRRRLRKSFTSSTSAHAHENIPTGVGLPAAATTIPAGSSMDAAVHAAIAPLSSIPAVDKGKTPMVDDSLPADFLSEQECLLKNLHDYQLGKDLAKKLHAEQEAEFARQQEELAQKAQAKCVALPTEHGPWLSDQRDDVMEDNMNEWLGMLLLHKRRELAEQSRVKPMTKTQQRDYMRDFVKNNSSLVYNQGWTMKKVKVPASVPAAPSFAADVSVPAAPSFAVDVSVSAATTPEVPAAESRLADTLTASAHVSIAHSVAASTPSSLRKRRKDIAKKRVTPIVDIADAALIKFDSNSGSDDDPLPYAPYADWEMVLSPLGSIHAYYDMAGHTKNFTSLRELLHMSLDDEDAHDFWCNQDSWRIHSWRLYPRAQVHILETVDGRVTYMFVDVSYPLSATTLERMLKHGLEVPKLLVGGDLTMAEQLSWLVQEQTALGKDKSNPLTVGSLLKTIWSSIHHLLTNEVLTSPEQTATGKDVSNPFMAMMVYQKPLRYFSSPMIHVPRAELVFNPPG
nr:putative ribonuclease H-like domain-containing protein [Tanacetum cinerariifolium]